MGREPDNILVIENHCENTQPAGYFSSAKGSTYKYKLLDVLEFTSTRKRMSVIVRNMQTGLIELYSKGADSIMEKLLDPSSDNDGFLTQTKAYIDEFSKEGLRTLMLTRKDISEREYATWSEKFKKALNSIG